MDKVFSKELIWLDKSFTDKDDLFESIGQELLMMGYVRDSFVQGLKTREAEYPTGLNTEFAGVAIPHTDVEHVLKPSISFIRLRDDLDFLQMGDMQLVKAHFVFMLTVTKPENQVEALSTLVALFSNREAIAKLDVINSAGEIADYLNDFFEKFQP